VSLPCESGAARAKALQKFGMAKETGHPDVVLACHNWPGLIGNEFTSKVAQGSPLDGTGRSGFMSQGLLDEGLDWCLEKLESQRHRTTCVNLLVVVRQSDLIASTVKGHLGPVYRPFRR